MADSIVDFPLDLLHLGPALRAIVSGIDTVLSDRGILITNQDAQQTQLTAILAAQAAQVSAISSSSAQLSANIAAVNAALSDKIDSLAAAQAALGAALSAKLDMVNTQLTNLISLLGATLQALQGVATLDAQTQMLVLLQELVQATSPERPRTLRLDVSNPVTTPQPIPPNQGPR